MEAEIANLRQEISQLRAQLSSAQLSSLAHDDSPSIQQQYRSSTETLQQSSTSPVTTVPGNNNLHKRKADAVDDPSFRAREFRNEMNKRQAIPPSMLPPRQRMEQQYTDSRREEQLHEQMHGQQQEQRTGEIPAGEYSSSSQFQKLGYSSQRKQPHGNQLVFHPLQDNGKRPYAGATEILRVPADQGRQFIDPTESVATSIRPPPLQSPRGGFIHQQQHQQDGSQSRSSYTDNINVPFQSPLRTPALRPTNLLPTRETMNGYFASQNHQSPGSGTGYGSNISQPIQGRIANLHPPLSRGEHMSPMTRQGATSGHLYDRGGQPVTPGISRIISKGGGSVVSPFFTDLAIPMNLGFPATGNGIRRPASVVSFSRQQGELNRSHGSGLGNGGFFSRQEKSLEGGLAGAISTPGWGTPRMRPGTVQGFGGRGEGNAFGLQQGSRVVDRPGLRRSVRRD